MGIILRSLNSDTLLMIIDYAKTVLNQGLCLLALYKRSILTGYAKSGFSDFTYGTKGFIGTVYTFRHSVPTEGNIVQFIP